MRRHGEWTPQCRPTRPNVARKPNAQLDVPALCDRDVPNRDPLHGNGSSMISYEVLRHLPSDVAVSWVTFQGEADARRDQGSLRHRRAAAM